MANDSIASLSGKRVIVLGDIMLDRYLYGDVHRISPEAPVPVMDLNEVDHRLGGAGNVALNIEALGSQAILCGLIGSDPEADTLLDSARARGLELAGFVKSPSRKTTLKTRVIAQGQHLLRVDREDRHALEDHEEKALKAFLENQFRHAKVDALVFQDYNKGVLNETLIKWVINICGAAKIPTLVDPKKENFAAYRGVTLCKPNLKEVSDLAGYAVTNKKADLQKAADKLRSIIDHDISLITLSGDGLFIEKRGDGLVQPTEERNITDVCGAGDTVLSIAALGLAGQIPIGDLAVLANLAGGQVCESVGAVAVNKLRLEADFLKIKG
jgi:D-glycero-beta-D-manno-heptose-7-phosphate kinase